VLIHGLDDALAAQERFDVALDLETSVDEELPDQGIAAGVGPVGLHRLILVLDVAQDGPRVVDDVAAEAVAVVPGAELIALGRGELEVAAEPIDLVLGEAEAGRVGLAQERVDLEVVEPGEHRLLGDAEDARQHALFEVGVVLQAGGEEIAEEGDDLFVLLLIGEGVVDGRVVLVDEDEGLLAGGLVEPLAQEAQGSLEQPGLGPPVDQALQARPACGVQRGSENVRQALRLFADDEREGAVWAPVPALDVLERDEDHRVLLEVRPDVVASLLKLKAGESAADVVLLRP
jgi:hypothetical protein